MICKIVKARLLQIYKKSSKKCLKINGKKHIIMHSSFKNNRNLVHFVINNVLKNEPKCQHKLDQSLREPTTTGISGFPLNTPEYQLSTNPESYKRGLDKEWQKKHKSKQRRKTTGLSAHYYCWQTPQPAPILLTIHWQSSFPLILNCLHHLQLISTIRFHNNSKYWEHLPVFNKCQCKSLQPPRKNYNPKGSKGLSGCKDTQKRKYWSLWWDWCYQLYGG